jgi:phospholipid transport system substrate-binding protein
MTLRLDENKKQRRRAVLFLLAACLLVRPQASRAADFAEVSEPIVALNAGLLQVMKAGAKVPFTRRFDMLAPVIDHAFDLPGILRATVGQVWAKMSEPERAELLAVFRQYTVASYVANFDDYKGERFEVLPGLRAVGSDQVVATRLVPPNGEPTRLDYVMRQTPAGWRAVDVLLNGTISNVVRQRSDFRSLLTGGSAAPLIASLKKKIADLSGGSLG